MPRVPAPRRPRIVARVSADGTVSEETTLPTAAGSGRGDRPQGRRREDRLPRSARLLDGDHAGLALPPERRRRSSAATRHRPGLRRPDHLPPARRRRAAGRARRSPRRRLRAGRRTALDHDRRREARRPNRRRPSRCRCSPTSTAGSSTARRSNCASTSPSGPACACVAKRRRRVVARTPMSTLAAGERRLLLRLDPRRWPTKLDLETHALAPLPVASTAGGRQRHRDDGIARVPQSPAPRTGLEPLL